MGMTREERDRRQQLDDGNGSDIVMIKQGHCGTQHSGHYHAPSCPRVDFDTVFRPLPDGDALHHLRDAYDWAGADWIPKTRAFERRGSKAPARCVLEDNDGHIPCPDCPFAAATITETLEHYEHAHLETVPARVAADGAGGGDQ